MDELVFSALQKERERGVAGEGGRVAVHDFPFYSHAGKKIW